MNVKWPASPEAFAKLPDEDQLAILQHLIKIAPFWPFSFCAGCAEQHVTRNEETGLDVVFENDEEASCACSCHE